MFRLLKIFVSITCFAVFIWWGLTVRLGDRTLFGHIYAIGQSKESKELLRGTKEKVGGLARTLGAPEATAKDGLAQAKAPTAPPQEQLSSGDRQEIRRVIEAARTPTAR